MRSRWKSMAGVVLAALALGGVVAVALGWRPLAVVGVGPLLGEPILVGLLHSQSGYLAISEKSLIDAEIMAIDEINAEGGVNGRRVAWANPDCRSDPAAFAGQARDLIDQQHVQALFGTWTSECRKAVLPVVAEKKNLLFFPGNYEGIDRADRAIYVGGSANQSVLPAVRWAFDPPLKARRFFVVGLEEVWSRTCCEIAKDAIRCAGGELAGEAFMPMLNPSIDAAIAAIAEAKPDVVLNFLVGDSNVAFYSAYRHAGLTPDKTPTIAFGFSEDESRKFVNGDIAGQYSAWNYFQTIDRPESLEFIRKFRKRFGESRLIGDSMVAAYNSIHFWAKAANEVGTSDATAVLGGLSRQSRDAPDGIITIDPVSNTAWRPFHMARVQPDGQFVVLYSILKPIRPVTFVATRSALDWAAFSASLKDGWQGRWSAPGGVAPPPPAPAPAR